VNQKLNTESRLRVYSKACSIITGVIAGLVIIGWLTNNVTLAQFGSSLKSMPLVAALGFLLLSYGLLIYLYKPVNFLLRSVAIVAVILVIVLSIIMIINDYTGTPFIVEQWFLRAPININKLGESRVSPFTLVSLLVLGLAILPLLTYKEANRKSKVWSGCLGVIALVIAITNLLGFLYKAPLFVYVGVGELTTTALSGSIASFFLSISVITAIGNEQFPLSIFSGTSLSALLMRSIVPVVIFLFIFYGWFSIRVIPSNSAQALNVAFLSVLFILVFGLLLAKITFKISAELEQLLIRNKAAEENLKDALFYNRSLLEASLDSLVTIDNMGKITDVNAATEQETGVSREQLIGSDFSRYFTDPKKANKGYKEVFKQGFVKDYELTIQSVSGKTTDVLYNAVVYKDRSEKISGVFAAARDITDLKKNELIIKKYAEDLERSNLELQQFAYIASHDLQEPLRVITSYLQLIERRYKDKLDQDANEFIDFAVDASSKLQEMINDLLAYSRVGTKGNPFAETDITQALKQALNNLELIIEENHAVITYDALPTLMADENQIVTVFQNLIANSIKFHKPNQSPEIHISAEKKENLWLFSVRDNGIGIDLKYKDKLFVIFKRLVGREYSGSGIGLAMCKRIIERHKGHIWVESELDKGSTFYFTIPG
jgi:PAS domain S-box-containing protein